jgi:hypothetical protein
MFPNPSGGNFFIESETFSNQEIEILDRMGALVYRAERSGTTSEINLQVAGGIYFYRVTEAGRTSAAGKLVVN